MYSNDRQIEALAQKLKGTNSAKERISILDETPEVRQFLKTEHPLLAMIPGLDSDSESALKQIIALGQAPLASADLSQENVAVLLGHLCDVDDFYRELGGIAGYQSHVRRLLEKNAVAREGAAFHSPSFVDISQLSGDVEAAVEAGIAAMPYLCEMYPLGGSADRLHLIDEMTGNELPAAKLKFAGKTLLERLLCDLESRELLYYQRTGRVLNTPVAIMTSHEKNNWIHIQEILQENNWFGRPQETFRLFVQPLVPVVDEKGDWLWNDAWKLLMKPGGHGAIWKLAKDNGVFDWFKSLGSKFALIRQINNPLAGLDYGLLAFTGYGYSKKMSFGFASCPRICQAAEGVNVLVERKEDQGYLYNLSNIEYCDFAKYGVEDTPMHSGEPFSRFTSNTNILFGQLDALEGAVGRCPFPGLLMNLKKDTKGNFAGRLESTMQNIADVFIEKQKEQLFDQLLSTTFITYNDRNKTISTAKKAYVPGNSLNETPEKCFYDFMSAAADLLKKYCNYELPPERTLEEMIQAHPSFVFLFHPSLGPLFRTIGEKIHGGRLSDGSEMQLEITDVDFESLDLDGSLQVTTKVTREDFTKSASKCILKNCKIENAGVDWDQSKPFWQGSYCRKETVLIELGSQAEFEAENVHFRGGAHFVVQDGEKMCVSQDGDSLRIQKKPRI
jgi:hypothetical protein